MTLAPPLPLDDDSLGEIVAQVVAGYDDFERPLLPFVRRTFDLNITDALTVLRAAAIVIKRQSYLPESTEDE